MRFQTEAKFSIPSQAECACMQTDPDGNLICPDFRAYLPRISCVQQTFVPSYPDFCALISLSCVRVQTFVPFTRFMCPYIQIIVRSPNFCSFISRFSLYQQSFAQSCPDFVHSPGFRSVVSFWLAIIVTVLLTNEISVYSDICWHDYRKCR